MPATIHASRRPSEVDPKRLDRAIALGHARLLEQQEPTAGSWRSIDDMGPAASAQVLITRKFVGRLSAEDARKGAAWLISQQREDGSFVVHPSARTGDVHATASVWAGLRASGLEESHPAVQRAWRYIQQNGGLELVGKGLKEGRFDQLFVSMATGLLVKQIPVMPLIWVLFPRVIRWLERRFTPSLIMTMMQMGFLRRFLDRKWGPGGKGMGWLARWERDCCLRYIARYQGRDGSCNGSTIQTNVEVVGFYAMGLEPEDDRLRRALQWLDGQKWTTPDGEGVWYDAFSNDIWASAFALRALLLGGAPRDLPEVRKVIKYLVDTQLPCGGWPFQKTNELWPDTDDTGVVLGSLGLALDVRSGNQLPPELVEPVREAVGRGCRWLASMQNPDGGWGAYLHGMPGKAPGPMSFGGIPQGLLAAIRFLMHPPPAVGDPSCEDMAGRILCGLGRVGYSPRAPMVQRAIAFLQKQQYQGNRWWGRWQVNYLACTANVLIGLEAVGADMTAPWIRAAVDWVKQCQNPDGGWGELPESYVAAAAAGRAPSMAPLTGLVLKGLLSAGELDSPQVVAGIQYLLDTQSEAGRWDGGGWLQVFVPPIYMYHLPISDQLLPLEALGLYRSHGHVLGRSAPPDLRPRLPDGDWNPAFLHAMRQQGDERADRVIQTLLQGGNIEQINGILRKLRHNDSPIPEELPSEVRDYLLETARLPDWADMAQLRLGQELFNECGLAIATALFCSALPQAYACANGARVLVQTNQMGEAHVHRRVFETAQFLFDVVDEGAFDPRGCAVRAIQKVRLMHAAIRHYALASEHLRGAPPRERWNQEEWGLPINQEDLAGTLMTFCTVCLDALERFGIEVEPAKASAWLHTWRVIGHLLGVDPHLLPTDVEDGRRQFRTICDSQWAPSSQGKTLINALVHLLQPPVLVRSKKVPIGLIRFLAGDRCADTLGLPRTGWTRVFAGVKVVEAFLGINRTNSLLRYGFGWTTSLLIKATTWADRGGRPAQFRIPRSLDRR